MADSYEGDRGDSGTGEDGPSVFDIFEPPPPANPKSFGKVPVIKDREVDVTDGKSVAEVQAAADAEAAGLQHWTAPPTGQVPAILSDKESKGDTWANMAGPRWHGEDPSWTGPDLADVFADADNIQLDDDEDDEDDDEYRRPVAQVPAPTRPAPTPTPADPPPATGERLAQTGPRTGEVPLAPAPERRPPPLAASARVDRGIDLDPDLDPDSDVDLGESPAPRPGAGPPRTGWPTSAERAADERVDAFTPGPAQQELPIDQPDEVEPGRPAGSGRLSRADAAAGAGVFDADRGVPSIDDIQFDDEPRERQEPVRRSRRFAGDDETDSGPAEAVPSGPAPSRTRRRSQAVDDRLERLEALDLAAPRRGGRNVPLAILVGVGLVSVLLAAMWFGSETTLLLVVALALVGVAELFNAMRTAGLRPATLLGVVGTVAAPLAAYYRGDAALPLLIGLTVIFGSLWYLVGADTERPVLNLSLTMMGIFWVGGLAAFAGLMLRAESDGVQLLLATIIITVASDTMAYIGGRAYGRRPFHTASPNKTWEGTMTGFLAAVFVGLVIGVVGLGTLWDDNLVPALALGVIVGLLAPIGDLAESVVKRDLGVKDMGHLLPGHGGVLDRVDALLFALPGAYYLGLVAGLI